MKYTLLVLFVFININLFSQSVVIDNSGTLTREPLSNYSWRLGGNTLGTTGTFGTVDARTINFITDNTTRMSLGSTGNIGIGMTPTKKLEICLSCSTTPNSILKASANFQMFSETFDGFQISVAGTSGYPIITNVRARGTLASPTVVSSGDIGARYLFQGYDGSGRINMAEIRAEVDGTPGTNDMPGRLTFYTTPDGSNSPVERARIDDQGNLGIRVTSPTAALHLPAGTASANTSPFKFTSGTNLTTPEAGAVEWNGSNLFITQTTGPTRKTVSFEPSIDETEITTTGTATKFTINLVDVSAGAATITPPSTPVIGDWFIISDSRANAATFNITVDTSADKLHGLAADYVMNTDSEFLKLTYINSTIGWIKSN